MTLKGFFEQFLLLFLLICLPISCATSKTMTVGATASLLEDVAQSAYRQSDLKLIREGMPAYLMLIGGMVQAVPDNAKLLITAAQALPEHNFLGIEISNKYARMCAVRRPSNMYQRLRQSLD